jgi:hypothetical protein
MQYERNGTGDARGNLVLPSAIGPCAPNYPRPSTGGAARRGAAPSALAFSLE